MSMSASAADEDADSVASRRRASAGATVGSAFRALLDVEATGEKSDMPAENAAEQSSRLGAIEMLVQH